MGTVSGRVRQGFAVSSLAAVAALAAGCGSSGGGQSSSSAPPSTPASPSASSASPASSPMSTAPTSKSTTPTGLAACSTGNLSVALPTNVGGGAAGSQYVAIQFTNTSGTACALYGFPGVSFVTGQNGSQIGAPAQRNTSIAKVTVAVASHATAHAWLQVAEAGNYPASSCHPVTAHWLKIYPPGNTAPAYLGRTFPACSSAKVVTMTIDPVRTGAAVEGQLP